MFPVGAMLYCAASCLLVILSWMLPTLWLPYVLSVPSGADKTNLLLIIGLFSCLNNRGWWLLWWRKQRPKKIKLKSNSFSLISTQSHSFTSHRFADSIRGILKLILVLMLAGASLSSTWFTLTCLSRVTHLPATAGGSTTLSLGRWHCNSCSAATARYSTERRLIHLSIPGFFPSSVVFYLFVVTLNLNVIHIVLLHCKNNSVIVDIFKGTRFHKIHFLLL